MWVIVSTVILLALVAANNVIGDTSTGQPWPANAAGYANFSQINPAVSTKLETDDDIPLLQSAPVPSSTNMINLDLSNPNTNIADALEKVLAPELANLKISNEQQKTTSSINITPPPNANMDFIRSLQAAVRVAVKKLVPSAGSSLKIAITKSSSGAIVNVKAYLDVTLLAAVTPTLPPSTVPEIDLTKSTSGLLQNLQIILLKELTQAGYNANSKSIQNFSLSFSILPPKDATKDYVRLYVLGPLQTVLKRIAPTAAITSVSVNTQESSIQILRQTVTFKIQIAPPPEFEINNNVVEVPEIHLNTDGSNVISTVITTLQDQLMKNAAVKPTEAKTLSIPFKITPPKSATQQQIQDLYITPVSQVLSKLDPTGKIAKISQKTLPNGDIVIIIYMNIPSMNPSSNGQIQPQTATTSKPVVITTTTTEVINHETETPVVINNRNSFPEEEDELPPETTDNTETIDSSQTSKPSSNEDIVPANAIKTSVVDLTTPTASVKNIQRLLDEELSPLSNPVDDGQPKLLAIPFKMIPPAGATLQQIEKNVVVPIGKLLTTLEPTGEVITSQTTTLPNGEVESVIYLNIPSIKDSKTYKVISDRLKPSTVVPGKSIGTETTVTPRTAAEPVVSPVTKSQQSKVPIIKPENTVKSSTTEQTEPSVVSKVIPVPENAVITSPIDTKQLDPAKLISDIQQRANEVRKNNNGQPQIIGFPFVLPGNQKPSFFFTQALKTMLHHIEPSGSIVQVGEPKTLPNGDSEFIIYEELPAVTTEKPREEVVEEQPKPKEESNTPKVLPEITPSKTQNEVQPENAGITSPIDLKQPDFATIPADIQRRLNEVIQTGNGQTIQIPFVLPGNQKPNYFLTQSLKLTIRTLAPPGTDVQISSEPKTLPNGDSEFIIYAKLPAVTTEKPNEEAVEEQTKPSVVSKVIPVPENAVITTPIHLKQLDSAELISDLQQRANEVRKNNNGQPQIIGFPFVLPGNQKPSFFFTQALKTMLHTFEPTGTIVQVGEPKTLPNGDTEFIIYDQLPAVTTEKPSEEVVEEQPKPKEESNIPKVLPEITPSKTRNEVQPENAVITSPIELKQPNLATIPADIQRKLNDVIKISNGQKIGIPFVLPGNQKPNYFLTQSLRIMMRSLAPSGTDVQISEPKTLPNGDTEFIIYAELPAVNNLKPSGRIAEKEAEVNLEPIVFPTDATEEPNVVSATEVIQKNIPIAAVEDVNLDEPGVTVEGEVGKALVKAVSTISSNANDLNKPANLKFNIYTPLGNSLSQNKKVINDVSSELNILEPNAKIITARTNDNPQKNGPDGDVEIVIPSISSSRTTQIINNALKIPTIDINMPELKLVENIKDLLQKGLKSVAQIKPKGSQLFNLNFRLNPFDTKGSVAEVLKALNAVDPKGKIVSYKIRSGLDGLDYLDVIYLIPRLEDSIFYKIVKSKKPEIIYESFIAIDTRNPFSGLLENVIKEEEAAEGEVQGATKGQLVDLPLDFKFTNSKGLSDAKVGEIISQTLPSIKGYISQILPKGKFISIDTVNLPNSDDVLLKILVRTPFEPDNTIVIDEVRPQVRTVVTTPKPKSRGLFGILGL